jgi:hypothetical protein
MSLFKCQKCGVIENTALTMCSWSSKKKLCSECCPQQGKWHNKFSKTFEMPKGEIDIFKKN